MVLAQKVDPQRTDKYGIGNTPMQIALEREIVNILSPYMYTKLN